MIPLLQKVVPSRSAVLAIDMQNDFCAASGVMASTWGVRIHGLPALSGRLRRFLDMARRGGVQIVFIRTARAPQEVSEAMKELMARRGGRTYPCMEGSWGAEFLNGFQPLSGDMVVTKKRYSAFWATDLDARLRAAGRSTVILTGVLTEVCVETTARDAFMRDYHVLVARDLTASPYKTHYKISLANIQKYFGTVVTSEDLLQTWLTVQGNNTAT